MLDSRCEWQATPTISTVAIPIHVPISLTTIRKLSNTPKYYPPLREQERCLLWENSGKSALFVNAGGLI